MSAALGSEEISAATTTARGLGWKGSDEQPVRTLEMEQVLRAAYEQPTGQPAELRSLSQSKDVLLRSIAARRQHLERLEHQIESREREVETLKGELAHVLEPERLLRYVKHLVDDLDAAGWTVATQAYSELRSLVAENLREED